MAISLDITGFYYKIDVDSTGVKTVLDVLNRAQGIRAPNGGVLRYKLDKDNRFVGLLSVEYDGSSSPQSRQVNSPFGPNRPVGTYSFADDVFSPTNRLEGSGNVPGLLAWQYYVIDRNGVDKNRVLDPTMRVITPVVEKASGYNLEDGDTVIFRLIAIFGLNQFLDAKRGVLVAESKGLPVSLKSAGSILKERNEVIQV